MVSFKATLIAAPHIPAPDIVVTILETPMVCAAYLLAVGIVMIGLKGTLVACPDFLPHLIVMDSAAKQPRSALYLLHIISSMF
ncbi:MAG: hypothetical protein IJV74_05925 [Clostridia bacterium]|nr:hypothetical protein [Clostridia bacterium]